MSEAPNVYDAEPIPAEARAEIDRMLQSGDLFRYTSADASPVALLEQEFAELLGAKFALAVSSCSNALFLSMKALGLPRDAKVLIPAFTFAAVPSSVVHAECQPILVEVADNYRVNMEDFAAKLTDDIQAVIISHMRGHTSDMDAIMELCDAKGVPVIEDAAHSLGTTWNGKNIGTIGKIGCFSFQSYKLINAGEGGIMITDDPDLIAQAIIMSGAYEHNWKKHPVVHDRFEYWQNKLPLYNVRMQNLSAAVIRPQIKEVPRRVSDGLANHDYVAGKLNASPFLTVPDPLKPESRAPDSIQFNLDGFTDEETLAFASEAKARGIAVQVFGLSKDNARAFWNWQFIGYTPELPETRAMLMRACDVRLPARLTTPDLDFIADALTGAAEAVKSAAQAVA
ncbi:DegT/DnrJ/EryC1/StrS family aminotransferase [Profundibacter sp.]|uniref:DegT/DnrJ/EryC1/StrS family aminotransferase n=1 Tax=Profundibacter sp. TaxID=3101071 RepID=UPI003D116B03